jgi:hypothetical protein
MKVGQRHRRNRYYLRRCGGQALVEFVLLMTLMIIVVVEIYTMIDWSSDRIDAQAASWFVVRSQTFDFINNNTPHSAINDLLSQAVFTRNQPFSTRLYEDDYDADQLIDNIKNGQIVRPVTESALYIYDLICVLSLDGSLTRTGQVDVYTRDYFSALPSYLDLAGKFAEHLPSSLGQDDTHRYFHSSASSLVYASWTSCAQSHDFDEDRAKKNLAAPGITDPNTGANQFQQQVQAEQQKLEAEAVQDDNNAVRYLAEYDSATDKDKKAEYWSDYEQAIADAARLRREAAAMSVPTPSPTP